MRTWDTLEFEAIKKLIREQNNLPEDWNIAIDVKQEQFVWDIPHDKWFGTF